MVADLANYLSFRSVRHTLSTQVKQPGLHLADESFDQAP
jgi:hypothetical protein